MNGSMRLCMFGTKKPALWVGFYIAVILGCGRRRKSSKKFPGPKALNRGNHFHVYKELRGEFFMK